MELKKISFHCDKVDEEESPLWCVVLKFKKETDEEIEDLARDALCSEYCLHTDDLQWIETSGYDEDDLDLLTSSNLYDGVWI